MTDSAVPFGLIWAALMGATTIGLMILLRPRVGSKRARCCVFASLVALATAFLVAAIVAVYIWPEARTFLSHTVAAVTFVLFAWIGTLLVLFVALVVLPMKRERSPRRGGFIKPQHGP